MIGRESYQRNLCNMNKASFRIAYGRHSGSISSWRRLLLFITPSGEIPDGKYRALTLLFFPRTVDLVTHNLKPPFR